jgi:hypothetical protein
MATVKKKASATIRHYYGIAERGKGKTCSSDICDETPSQVPRKANQHFQLRGDQLMSS